MSYTYGDEIDLEKKKLTSICKLESIFLLIGFSVYQQHLASPEAHFHVKKC